MAATRDLYRHKDLIRILNPRSVAVVGASPTPTAAGSRAVGQLEKLGYGGAVHLVNAKYEVIGDRICHPSVQSLPEAPDAVIITVPRVAVEDVVLDAVAAGAGSAIIFAAGFADTGREDRIAQQERLSAIARETGIRIIGPNCLGAVNYVTGAALTYTNTPVLTDASGAVLRPHARSIGLVSQSGGLGFAAAQAIQRGVSFSHLLTSGNSADVDVGDLIAFLAEDPGCSAIACVFEATPNPERLLEAASLAQRAGKPVVIHKLGSGEQGAAAALTHSGMLAGAHDVYLAAFDRAGMIVVDNFENLIETASFCAKAKPDREQGVVVLTSSGGASVMAADKAEIHDVPLPQPAPDIRVTVQERLPDFGTARNPCDVTGGVANDLDTFFACVDLLMSDPSYGMLVTAHPYSVHTANRVRAFAELAAKHDKLVNNVWITEYLSGPGLMEAESDLNSTVFRSMDRCFASIGAYQDWEDRRRRRLTEPAPVRTSSQQAMDEARELISAAGAHALTEREAKAVLAAYGVQVVGETLTDSADAAVAAAQTFGFPVAMKVESPDIPHKTEAGVIRLNLRNGDEVRLAYQAVTEAAARVSQPPRINGVLVQPMAPSGVEIMIGGRIDAQFGPVVILGFGGVLVELLQDTVVAQAPVSQAQAREMLDKLKAHALLDGFRGAEPVDRDRVADALVRISEMLADQADLISELDVNPLICGGPRAVAVDALIARSQN